MNWPPSDSLFWLFSLPIAGALAGHLWTRFRNRLVPLRWTVHHQAWAFASNDQWGKIEILFDGQPTANLHVSRLEIQNSSSRDLQEVSVAVLADIGTLILRSVGQLRGSSQAFPFALDFAAMLEEASKRKLTQQELAYWGPRAGFVIPVLNRGSIADFVFLLSRPDYQSPSLTVTCEHLGARLEHKPPAPEVWGVRQPQAQRVGILAALALTAVAVWLEAPGWAIGFVGWFTGLFAIALGAAIVRPVRRLFALAD